jgi:hypothetical protein
MAKINSWHLEKFITDTVSFLVENAEDLSTRRWSNMHKIENYVGSGKTVYRIHESYAFPQMIQMEFNGDVVVEICNNFNENNSPIEYDRGSMWFTIWAD